MFKRIFPALMLAATIFFSNPASATFTYLPPSNGENILAMSTTEQSFANMTPLEAQQDYTATKPATMDPNAHILGQLIIPGGNAEAIPAREVGVPNTFSAPPPDAATAPLVIEAASAATAPQPAVASAQSDKCSKKSFTDKAYIWLSSLGGGGNVEKLERPCYPRTTSFYSLDKNF